VLSWLTDPFAGPLMQRALAEVLLLALACGPLGVWIVLYRQSYAAESIAHGMLPGLVLAALAGAPLLLGALGGVVLAAAAISLAGRDERVGGDAAVAVVVSALFGLGALLALSPAVPPRLGELLFGDLLGVAAGDLLQAGALAAAVALAFALGHRRLALAVFDPAAARSLGARPGRAEAGLLILLALCTVAAVQGLGNLLAVALVLAPGAAALNVTRRLPATLAASVAIAALAGVAGLLASYHWKVAAGASVALAAVVLFGLSLVSPRAGVARPTRRRAAPSRRRWPRTTGRRRGSAPPPRRSASR
jgi:ABC-type Mn2+/Zn2+ transport system permease subunit